MNLYIFNQTRRGTLYGVGTYIRELTAALKGSNISVCVINLISEEPQIQTEEIDGIKYWHFPPAISDQLTKSNQEQWELYYRNIVYLLRLFIEDKTNLIFHLNFFESGKLAEELKNTFDCHVVAVSHFSDWGFTIYDNPQRLRDILNEEHPDSFGEKLKQKFEEEKSYYSKVDHVICLSNYMKDILCRDYELLATKISVIPNGLSDTAGTIADGRQLRKKWNIPEGEKIIVFAGRIDKIKGVEYLIRSFHKVLGIYPDCRLIIAGSGDYDTLFKDAKDICTKISFTGFLEKSELNEVYQIADIGVVPSLFEPFGYVAVEMMMNGLPVVTTATSGLNEVVDYTCGLKIPLTVLHDSVEIDSDLLAEKIIYLLQHPVEAQQMGQNGRRKYLTSYSSDIFRKNMSDMYKSLYENREDGKIKTLIITGQNNHNWKISHAAIKLILDNSGLFKVDVALSPETGGNMFHFKPDFASYQLIVLDYCGDRWPEETERSFLSFVEKGGGLVVYHSANNAFRDWKEYNQIIGFGGWDNRNETDGPYIYYKDGEIVYDSKSPGIGGSHGPQHEFILNCGNPEHPVTQDLPIRWRHAQDELYDSMRGTGTIKDVLFWAYSDPQKRGTGREEIAVFTVDYGKARIFHTTLGHAGNTLNNNVAMQCTGFQVMLLRGAEWAATGMVTQPVPDDFPTETITSLRRDYK